MEKSDRNGKRKNRYQEIGKRIPKMGYYLIVTDTKGTERCYFNGLYESLSDDIKAKLVIKVVETKIKNLIEKCLELTAYEAQYRIPWIVFDGDQVINFDSIIEEAVKKDIKVAWSNPCFETWMFGYFGNIPVIYESWKCCNSFGNVFEKQTGQKYFKNDDNLYQKLYHFGDEQVALNQAKLKYDQCIRDGKTIPSNMCPCTTVYELVKEIRNK